MKTFPTDKILEIGNVLAHYFPIKHDVLDKYESGDRIIMEDAVTYTPPKKYDLILSISTFEHVGIDDSPKDPTRALLALRNLQKNALSKKGMIFISFPLNYNSSLTDLIENGRGYEMFCFKKINPGKNVWQQTNYKDIRHIKYSQPVKAVVFLKISKTTRLDTD